MNIATSLCDLASLSASEVLDVNSKNLNANIFNSSDSQSAPDSGSSTGTAILERPETEEDARLDDGGDSDRFAHYVDKMQVQKSMLTGRPVVALCGKVWIPKQNPDNYPVCPECQKIYDQLGKMGSFGM